MYESDSYKSDIVEYFILFKQVNIRERKKEELKVEGVPSLTTAQPEEAEEEFPSHIDPRMK